MLNKMVDFSSITLKICLTWLNLWKWFNKRVSIMKA